GVSLNWQDLRPWQGSQHRAFEEVCAQLAAAETPATGATFVRKGTPDAGVECYWRLVNGQEWAWQTKFFTSMGDAQWRQLDESVRTALDRHPGLVKYIVCVPLDFADPRMDRCVHAMDRWRDHLEKWEGWAREGGKSVVFTLWGQHELANRLLQDEHRGRLRYWFDKQFFSNEWFDDRLQEAIANADQRYLPELHVDLAIQEVFRGLGRTPEFFDAVRTMQGKVRRAAQHLASHELRMVARDETEALARRAAAVVEEIEQLNTSAMEPLPLVRISQCARAVADQAVRVNAILWDAERQGGESGAAVRARPVRRSFDAERYFLDILRREAITLADLAESPEAMLANTPALLLVGPAGTGKSHLLCRLASVRKALDRPTILILSEQLANGEPWTEILRVLQLQCDADEFLGALNAAGQARGLRVLIAIDALNEGEGRAMWERHLPGFLVRLARYPWVGLVVSVRSSYETTVIREGLVGTRLVRVEHRGFYGAEARAAIHFFAHHGIVAPTIPPLHPEFSSPLFLRLFCQALQSFGYQQIPSGLHGLTAVFTFFLDSVNAKVARCLDIDPGAQLVQRCVDGVAAAMANTKRRWLPREDAWALIESYHSNQSFTRSLFRQLVLEGVLAEDRFYTGEDEWTEGVRFTYEKFSDHLITRHLLKRHLSQDDPASSFAPGSALADLVHDDWSCWQHSGTIEALAVQLPESVGQELPELVPQCASFGAVREAVVNSIVWRDVHAFTQATQQYLNEWLLSYEDTFPLTMSALLTVATQVDHPYNARTLHRNLCQRTLPDRDAWWSTYLHYEYSNSEPS
ncbi:MAG: ATP-binding protein, partial [Candidatus Solibacter usitatus]|nr:ATP-binding protein [Candidatus Solibacter usitatus]